MTSRLLAERTPVEEEKVTILVAKRNVSVGERIKIPEEMFEAKQVAKADEPPDAVKEFDALKGKLLRQGRNKGDHVTASNLYDKDGLDIPEGHSAVGVPVNLVTTAHGWASLPGSRVDLILVMKGPDNRSSTARVLLQNVLVLAADARTNREGELIAPASVVVFALKDDEKLKVKLAEQMGSLSLTLRRLNDPSHAQTTLITGDDLLSNKKKEPEDVVTGKPEVKSPPAITPSVEVPMVEGDAPRSGHHQRPRPAEAFLAARRERRDSVGELGAGRTVAAAPAAAATRSGPQGRFERSGFVRNVLPLSHEGRGEV
jgi:Flp pilus assembly protein CpaB